MRSIIDEITSAETQADQIRQDAAAFARDSMTEARAEADENLRKTEAAQREITRTALERAEQEGEELSSQLLTRMNRDADQVCQAAEARMEDAVSYIIERVRSGQ